MDVKKTEIDAIESKGLSSVGTGLQKDEDVVYRRAFGNYIRNGETRLSEADRAILSVYRTPEKRDVSEGNIPNQIGTYSSLGYFVPAGFVYDVETATKYFAPLLNGGVFTVMDTASGNPLPYPTSNDTQNVGYLVGERWDRYGIDPTLFTINLAAGAYQRLGESIAGIDPRQRVSAGELACQQLRTASGPRAGKRPHERQRQLTADRLADCDCCVGCDSSRCFGFC